MLWPAADKRTGAKSFYRVWGDLRSLLSQQGSCPYLIRSRYGCRLDPDLFESDLDEFEELIRCLLFGPADDMAWERAIATIQGSFGSVLLPTERKCEAIVVFRDRLDAEFVDGLVAASRRLLVRGELQGALWLAREAFQRDAGREDAAAALMRAQMATD
ncbi:MAG: AfsR/SARP family transcriptional regulator, partial [Adlercreutzia equolifaciens]